MVMGLLLTFGSSCSDRDMKFSLLKNSDIGIDFENKLTYTEDFNAYLFRSFYNGAGVGLADLTNDGNLDLFLCGNQTDNKLYLGDGNFNFIDVTAHAGVASPGSWTTGVSIVDINGDGWKDIYVCKSGRLEDENRRNELFIHNGLDSEGLPIFTESAKEYGIDDLGFSIHAVFLDYDRDGDLDMYLSNNSQNPAEMIVDSKKGLRNKRDSGGGNKLYRNEGNFFVDVSEKAGIYGSAIGFGLGVAVGDINRDGWPDIYVANDFFEKDYLYINQQDGTFKESIDQCAPEISLGSMGVDIADMNHDGYPEVFVTEMLPEKEGRLKTKALFDDWDKYALKIRSGYHRQFPRNTFQINHGRHSMANKVRFSEISRYAGMAATDWSWGVQMLDVDNDGNKEVFITNGIAKDLLDQDYLDFYDNTERLRKILAEKGRVITELLDNMPSQPVSNYLYRLRHDLVFENVALDYGLAQASFSNGAAYGDIDNDGDLDLVVNNIDAPPSVYRNDLRDENRHYLNVTLKNLKGNTAIGAQLSLWAHGKLYFEELYPMRGSMSVVDDRLHIGLGKAQKVDSLKIRWPDGGIQRKRDIAVDQFLTISQAPEMVGTIAVDSTCTMPKSTGLENHGLEFVHRENDFVDFDRDKLLFHMVSNEGPKLAVGDVNGDGLDDCYIGGAKGRPGVLFVREGDSFKKTNEDVFRADRASEDQDALFFDADGDKDMDLLVASGGYEFAATSFALLDRLYLNNGNGDFVRSKQSLPSTTPTSTSVVVYADYDRDGDQDLFFGSRLVPGFYGLPASGFLLENDGKGSFTNVTGQKAPGLKDLGLVTDAAWSDVDGDGDRDLIVVGEWMPVKLFLNDNGMLIEIFSDHGLENSNGLWNTLHTADLDQDGDEDLVVGNLGDNSFFKASLDRPVQLFVNDFDGNGHIEQVTTAFNGDASYPVNQKKEMTKQMPHLLKKYLKYADYKEQAVTDIFTEQELEKALTYRVFETGSCIFWNEGGRFTKQKLPFMAQLSPIYAISAIDVNGDQRKDLILGGNQYRAKPQTGIYAAGYGLVLVNEGERKFGLAGAKEYGFHVAGQVRDLRPIRIEGQMHMLVARNNDSLKVFHVQ